MEKYVTYLKLFLELGYLTVFLTIISSFKLCKNNRINEIKLERIETIMSSTVNNFFLFIYSFNLHFLSACSMQYTVLGTLK